MKNVDKRQDLLESMFMISIADNNSKELIIKKTEEVFKSKIKKMTKREKKELKENIGDTLKTFAFIRTKTLLRLIALGKRDLCDIEVSLYWIEYSLERLVLDLRV